LSNQRPEGKKEERDDLQSPTPRKNLVDEEEGRKDDETASRSRPGGASSREKKGKRVIRARPIVKNFLRTKRRDRGKLSARREREKVHSWCVNRKNRV